MSKQRILIVEDDSDLSEMLDAYFRTQDYDVLTAAWGAEALQLAHDHPVNLVMLDIRLPDITGYEVCRQLRSQRRTQDVPILFLTEKRDRMDRLQGLELGVVDYITKPFDIQELRLRVRNTLLRVQKESMSNRVTDLPEGALVDEKLMATIYGKAPWAAVGFSLHHLDVFRERYGFVAADDVVRAVALMVRNAVRELGKDDDFIGHLGPTSFMLLTSPERAAAICERVQVKMALSREFFYPLQDRETDDGEFKLAESELLDLRTTIVDSAGSRYPDADAVRAKIEAGWMGASV
jgi:PleD family two-component response regulator